MQTKQDGLSARKEYKLGMICALSSAFLWGFLPLYWQALRPIDSFAIIFYRIVLVGLLTFVLSLKLYGWNGIKQPFREKGTVLKLFAAGALVSTNWSIYIYAVNANYVIQTCIGYYIEPLMVCVFGIIFFKERPTKYKFIALVCAALGLAVILIHFRQFPTIALSLAVTFATYTAIKKHLNYPAVLSLMYETIFLIPVAVAFIIYFEVNGKGAFAVAQPYQLCLLFLAGLLTATPLGLFTMAANRISLISLGVTEYIAPSITLIIGIFLLKEPFDLIQLIAFAVIWVGLIFFTYGESRTMKESRIEEEKANEVS